MTTASLAPHPEQISQLQILDLQRRIAEIEHRLAEFASLYNVVKNERSKYVHLIQTSAQASAEMKEKVKILQNEVDILQDEARAKVRREGMGPRTARRALARQAAQPT